MGRESCVFPTVWAFKKPPHHRSIFQVRAQNRLLHQTGSVQSGQVAVAPLYRRPRVGQHPDKASLKRPYATARADGSLKNAFSNFNQPAAQRLSASSRPRIAAQIFGLSGRAQIAGAAAQTLRIGKGIQTSAAPAI